MKLKLITLILLLFSLNTIHSQSKELFVEYGFYFKGSDPEHRTIELKATNKESISATIRTIMLTIEDKETGDIEHKPSSSYQYIYKTRDSLFYKEGVKSNDDVNHFVSESLNQFNWKLTGNKKNILNYNCEEATTTFRGRDYIAYFTTEIPFKAAPWKFHGLPGVLLEVSSADDVVKMEAKTLKIQPHTETITNPFTKNQFITWEAYKKLHIKERKDRINRNISKLKSLNMDPSIVSRGAEYRLEIIIPENAISYDDLDKKEKN